MKNDDEIIESLIARGVIGASLGALLIKKKEDGVSLGSLAAAAILATFKAAEKARETKLPLFVEENGMLYQIQVDGNKKLIRKLEKPSVKLSVHFKLK